MVFSIIFCFLLLSILCCVYCIEVKKLFKFYPFILLGVFFTESSLNFSHVGATMLDKFALIKWKIHPNNSKKTKLKQFLNKWFLAIEIFFNNNVI